MPSMEPALIGNGLDFARPALNEKQPFAAACLSISTLQQRDRVADEQPVFVKLIGAESLADT